MIEHCSGCKTTAGEFGCPIHRPTSTSTEYYTAPFRCPVCEGRGLVPGGFYTSVGHQWTSNRVTEPCRSCEGKGLIWAGSQSFQGTQDG